MRFKKSVARTHQNGYPLKGKDLFSVLEEEEVCITANNHRIYIECVMMAMYSTEQQLFTYKFHEIKILAFLDEK